MLVGGNDIPRFEGTPPSWVEDLWIRDDGRRMLLDFSCINLGEEEKKISPYYIFGCNFSVRKSILDITGGFHPDGMPDELLKYRGDGESYIAEYIEQNGMVSLFVPGASVYHSVPQSRMTMEYVGKIAYRSGITGAYTLLRNDRIKELKRQLRSRKWSLPAGRLRMGRIAYMKAKRYYEGMLYLTEQYEKDERLKEWITRKDYLGDHGYI